MKKSGKIVGGIVIFILLMSFTVGCKGGSKTATTGKVVTSNKTTLSKTSGIAAKTMARSTAILNTGSGPEAGNVGEMTESSESEEISDNSVDNKDTDFLNYDFGGRTITLEHAGTDLPGLYDFCDRIPDRYTNGVYNKGYDTYMDHQYDRWREIEKKMNCKIQVDFNGNWATTPVRAQTEILSGIYNYNMIFAMPPLSTWSKLGLLTPLNDYLPWDTSEKLNDPMVKALSIWNGKYYTIAWEATGNRPYLPNLNLHGVIYNTSIMERLGLPDLFELYQQGQWNWDKVIEIGRIAHQDYDGNGTIDTYGISFMSAGLAAQNFSQANGIPLIESRDNNFVTNIDSPAFYRAMNFLSDLVNVYRITTPVSGSSYYYNIGRAFMQLGAQMDWSSHWAYNRTGAYVKSRIVPTPIGPDNSEGKIITTMAPIGWQIPITEKDKEGMARLMYNMVWTRTDPTALKLSDEQNVNDAIKYLDTRMWPGASDDWADILDFWINGRVSSDLISSAKIDYIDSFPDIKTTLDKQLLSQIVTYTPVSQIINSAGPVLNSMLEQYN